MKNLLFLIIILGLLTNYAYSQEYDMMNGLSCEEPTPTDVPLSVGGSYKPEKTIGYTGTSTNVGEFRILVIFVQFDKDDSDPGNESWPAGEAPAYMDDILASTRSTNYGSSWWNAYNSEEETWSDYFMEVSRGKFHVTGKAYNIILDNDFEYYQTNGQQTAINNEIYNKVQAIQGFTWNDYDKWDPITNSYQYAADDYIDMIYIVHRTWRHGVGLNPGSIAQLDGSSFTTNNNKIINPGYGFEGSGCRYTPGRAFFGPDPEDYTPYSPFSKAYLMNVQAHELGHYIQGSHCNYDVMMGTEKPRGIDMRMNPFAAIRLGYMDAQVVNYSSSNTYSIGDWSARNSNQTGEVLEVPTSSSDFFLLTYRNKISDYDRIMFGDTAHDDAYRNINFDYGKGLYIYHSGSPYTTWPPNIDLECADGLYNWQTNGTFTSDWGQNLTKLVKTSVSYNNDVSTNANIYTNRDDKSVDGLHGNWGSIGKLHQSLHGDGTDRIYTNDEDTYTSRAGKGDRFDAWRVGYNEVFSPYSSPSTNTWGNAYSGIFIWLDGEGSNTASLKIYKDDAVTGGATDIDVILEATPPSRPMGLKVEEHVSGSVCHPKLTWNHNMEPDMLTIPNGEGIEYYKRYKIFRATYLSMYGVPGTFTEIADIYTDPGTTPSYIDDEINMYYCSVGEDSEELDPYPVRYRIKAVDDFDDESVFSDFTQTIGAIESGGPIDPDRPTGLENDTPKEFSLKQNYPNPFNPSTNIQFDLPKEGFVSIKIYDMLGREVATLVNEFRNAGSYIVGFNGSNLSSGIYYYKIKAGTFEATKRMVLIK